MATDQQPSTKENSQLQTVRTQGGTAITGNVDTQSGDFVARDKVVQGNEVQGDNVTGNKTNVDSNYGVNIIIEAGATTHIEVSDVLKLKDSSYTQEIEDNDRYFSRSIRDYMAEIHRNIDQLTNEQYRVIDMLKFMKRVRISGCAGSGKTLVAAEKACRLAEAGHKVLFLCHNPLLSEYVRELTVGTNVNVIDFCCWIAELVDSYFSPSREDWSHYQEPDKQTLTNALDKFNLEEHTYDAIIVDEGQDFRNEWWEIVNAALRSTSKGWFYIFHDNNQSLLPKRGIYPFDEPQIDLSRNCRNSGRIYELMRYYDSSSPEPELNLKELGELHLIRYDSSPTISQIREILQDLFLRDLLSNAVILMGGYEELNDSYLSGLQIPIRVTHPWQDEIKRQFRLVLTGYNYDGRGVKPRINAEKSVKMLLSQLSDSPLPTQQDVQLVIEATKCFQIDGEMRRRIAKNKLYKDSWHWRQSGRELQLGRHKAIQIWSAEPLIYLENEYWPYGIPEPQVITITPYRLPQTPSTLPLYKIEDFKGLEADTVILILRGKVQNHSESVYVGVSRARIALIVLADRTVSLSFPTPFDWQ